MEAVLEAQARDTFGKNEARRTRRGGQVPGVLYGGGGTEAVAIAVRRSFPLPLAYSQAASTEPMLSQGWQVSPLTR